VVGFVVVGVVVGFVVVGEQVGFVVEGFVVGKKVGFVVEGFVVVGEGEGFVVGLNMVVNESSEEGRSHKEVWCHNIQDVLEGTCKWDEEQKPSQEQLH